MSFKSFAEVKRAMVPGSTWSCTHNGWKSGERSKDMGIRKVQTSQSNGVAFESKTDEGGSWFYYPKANMIRLLDDCEGFEVMSELDPTHAMLTYKKVS